MKYATFLHDGQQWSGVVADDRIHPFDPGIGLLELIQAGESELRAAGARALTGSRPSRSAGSGSCRRCSRRPYGTS